MMSDPGVLLAAKSQAASSTAEDKELYAFHHGVIPGILFSENGTLFFNDLFSGTTGPFMKMAEESLGATYAAGIKIAAEHFADFDIVLMSFPEPAFEPFTIMPPWSEKTGSSAISLLKRATPSAASMSGVFSVNGKRVIRTLISVRGTMMDCMHSGESCSLF